VDEVPTMNYSKHDVPYHRQDYVEQFPQEDTLRQLYFIICGLPGPHYQCLKVNISIMKFST